MGEKSKAQQAISIICFHPTAQFKALFHKKTRNGIPPESVELVGVILLKKGPLQITGIQIFCLWVTWKQFKNHM